ncbi:hmu [Linum perenne]
MMKKQQKLKATEGGRQTSGVQKDKGKQKAATSAVQKDKGKQKAPSRSSSRLKASENPKTPTTATTSKKRKEKPTTPDSDSDFDIPLMQNVHRKKKLAAVQEPTVKRRAAVQFRCKTRPLLDISLNYAKYLNEDFSLIGQLNWGKYVVDTLLLGLDEFQSKLSYPSGDFNFLALHCLDMVELEGLEAATAPTCGYWDDGRVSNAVKMMKGANGDWKFKLKSREGMKRLPLCETPWIDELFESVPTQPTQEVASSSAPGVGAIHRDGLKDSWAEMVDESFADLTQLALLKAIAEAEVKNRMDLIRTLRAECTLWEAREAVVVQVIEKKDDEKTDDEKKNDDDDKDKSEEEEEDNDDDEDEDEDEDDDEDKDEDKDDSVPHNPMQDKGDKADKAVDDKKEDSSSSEESSGSEESSSSEDDDSDDDHQNDEEYKDKAVTPGVTGSRKFLPGGETVIFRRLSPPTSEDTDTSSSDDSAGEGPSVRDIGKAAVAQAEKEIPTESDAERPPGTIVKEKCLVKVKSYTPVVYERPKTGSKVIGSPYVLEKRLQKQLTVDENILVNYVLREDDKVGELICIFPEKGNSLVRMQASTLAYNEWFCSSVVNAIAHYLNRQHMERLDNITRMCFPLAVAVFFPIYGGKDYEHFYVFGVDFEKREKFILNSLPCRKSFEKDLLFKPTGTRLMTYARPLLLAEVGVDISPFPWKVPSTPVQPDVNSCGLYVARFMEHYIGRIKDDGNWQEVEVMKLERLRYLCRLVKDKWNKCQRDVVVAAHKYDDEMRAEARVQRSMARSQARKKTRATRKQNNKA